MTAAKSVCLALAMLFAVTAELAYGCSMSGCSNGHEVSDNFSVTVLHAGKPLSGARVTVDGGPAPEPLTLVTDSTGRVQFTHLKPGNYSIETSYLDVSAGGECFHVNSHPSLMAKNRLKYEWGRQGITLTEVRGTVQHWQPDPSVNAALRTIRGTIVPTESAILELTDVGTGEKRQITSDANGAFNFPEVPAGTWVLTVKSSSTNSDDQSNHVVSVNKGSPTHELRILRTISFCGDAWQWEMKQPSN